VIEAQIKNVEKKFGENKAVPSNYRRDYQMFMQTVNDKKNNAEELRTQKQQVQERINHIDQQIHQFEYVGKDTLPVYGQSAGRVLKELQAMYRQK
jgi:DNA repair exonuclease SbcCD ATPase subunit